VNIRVELLGQPQRVRDALCRDGWELTGIGTNVIASHPEVPDEGTARTHLYALGLLTRAARSVSTSCEAAGSSGTAVPTRR
jgi:hypothetical protein